MKFDHLFSVVIVLFMSVASLSSIGCATSNASYARVDSTRSLTMDEYDTAAQKLVDEVLLSPAFNNFRKANTDKAGQTVIMVTSYRNDTDDRSTIPLMKGFFEKLEEYSLEKGISYSNDLEKVAVINAQDADDRYDQSTGTVTTGAAAKSVIALEIIFETIRSAGSSRTQNEFSIRVKFIDAARATTITSKSFRLTKS